MKKYVRLLNVYTLLMFGILLFFTNPLAAFDDDNYIIITGQVINTEYGNPLNEHPVFIKSESVAFSANFYFKELETDEDGFFYDTISTEKHYGSLEIYTFDHNGNKEKEVLHFRILDFTNTNSFLVNFHIYMPLATPVVQARFRYIKKTTGDRFRFKFVDETQNERIKSWYWEFGDGITSDLQDPEHIYGDYGMYKVDLTVVVDMNGNELSSKISKYIFIPRINYYHLGGHCKADQFPIDKGYAFLYQIDENEVLIPFDTTTLNDTLGHYYFYQLPEGKYCVKTQPAHNSDYYGTMVPTYYGDTEFWNDATIINHNHTDYDYHVNLIEGTGVPEGNGIIAGMVTFTNTNKSTEGYSSTGVPVYLLDELNKPMSYQYTDEYGSFQFDNIAIGTYWIYPEIAGFDLNKQMIELTDMIPVVEDVEILIDTDAVYLIFPDRAGPVNNLVSDPYPNPASGWFSFDIHSENSTEADLFIIDLRGKTMVSEKILLRGGSAKKTIETSDLTPGIYLIRLHANGITDEKKVLISH